MLEFNLFSFRIKLNHLKFSIVMSTQQQEQQQQIK